MPTRTILLCLIAAKPLRRRGTPTSASWLNMVERFFRDNPVNRLRRDMFTSVAQRVAAIDAYVAHHTTKPKPFIWNKVAADIC